MSKGNISYPDDLPQALKQTDEETVKTIKKFSAIKLYEVGKLSIGQSAKLAEMNVEDFLKFMGENKISLFKFNSVEELKKDIENAGNKGNF